MSSACILHQYPGLIQLFFRSHFYWRWFWLYRLVWFLRRWNFCFLSHVEYRSKLLRVWDSLWNLKNPNRISNLLLYNIHVNLFDLASQFALWLQIIDGASRQRVITHSWEIIGLLANTSGLASLCESWGSKLRTKNVLNAYGSVQLRYKQLRLWWTIKARGNVILCEAIISFWFLCES